MKLHPIALLLLAATAPAGAADVELSFDPVTGAEGYRIEMSTDMGATWEPARDTAGATSFIWTAAPEDALLLFRASAYTAEQNAARTWSGAWYDHRLIPLPTPAGAAIR